MNLKEFFEWLGTECLYPDGTKYYRPEFMWYDKVHNYYMDLVMYRPTYCRSLVMDPKDEDRHRIYWKIQFMLSPYASRIEYPGLLNIKEASIHEACHEWKGVYNKEELGSAPVEFWLREAEDNYTRVKIRPFGKPGDDIPNTRKFLIEYA